MGNTSIKNVLTKWLELDAQNKGPKVPREGERNLQNNPFPLQFTMSSPKMFHFTSANDLSQAAV